MQLKTRIGGVLAAGTLFAAVLVPGASASTVSVTGNGAGSTNTVVVWSSNSTKVGQSNSSVISNQVSVGSNTGGNSASKNTGGSSSISTGDANTTVAIGVTGSTNSAWVNPCGCGNGVSDITISDNGFHSKNTVIAGSSHKTHVWQSNSSLIENGVGVDSNTGGNKANKNTGGDSEVTTGDATTNVTIGVTGSSNTLNPSI